MERLKKSKKLILLFLFLLVSVFGVNANLNTGLEAAYHFENTSDWSGNGNTLTYEGTTLTTDKNGNSNKARSFSGTGEESGSNDAAYTSSTIFSGDQDPLTINMFVNLDSLPTSQAALFGEYASSSGATRNYFHIDSSGFLIYDQFTPTNGVAISTSSISTGEWVMVTMTKDTDTLKFYIDGNLTNEVSHTETYSGDSPTISAIGGRLYNGAWSHGIDGKIDEPRIYNRALDESEILDLYYLYDSEADSFNVTVINFTNISVNGNESWNNSLFNTSSLDFYVEVENISTNSNIDINYTLFYENGSNTTEEIASNSLSSNFSLNLTDGNYNISFFAENNETNATSDLYSFEIDTQPANVSVNSFTEWNDGYNVTNLNTTLNITCEDPNILECEIHWDDNTTTNIFTTQYKVFNTNGNHSFVLHSHDDAGNTAQANGTIFINPYQYFRFNDEDRSILVNDYEFGNYTINTTTLRVPLYELGFGDYTFEFNKNFYIPENFSFSFNNTSELNVTYNVTPVDFSLQVFDEDTLNQLTFNLTIQQQNGTLTQFNNQFDFQKFSDELPEGELILRINKVGYSERKIFALNDPFQAVSITSTLLNSSQSTAVIFEVLQSRTKNPIEDAELIFKKITNGTEILSGEALTDEQGLTFFNMDALDEYTVIIEREGFKTQSFSTIPGKTEYTVLLTPTTEIPSFFLSGLSYDITPTNFKQVPFLTKAQVIDSQNKISAWTYTVTGDNTSFTETRTDSSGGTISFNITNFSNLYILNLTITREGETRTFIEKLRYFNESDGRYTLNNTAYNFLQTEEDPANRVIFMILIYILAMVTGAVLGGLAGGSKVAPATGAMAGIIPIIFYIYTGFLSLGVGAIIILATVMGVLYFKQ